MKFKLILSPNFCSDNFPQKFTGSHEQNTRTVGVDNNSWGETLHSDFCQNWKPVLSPAWIQSEISQFLYDSRFANSNSWCI